MSSRLIGALIGCRPDAVSRRHEWLMVLFAALLTAFTLWPGRAGLPPIDRDESRYAQSTRQMLETGDFLEPRFQNQPRYVQPVGVYWLQAAAVRLAGRVGVRDIWPHRLPSLVAGLVAVALTALIGSRLFAPHVAFLGAALLAASLLFNFEARIATTDATLLACILAGQLGLLLIWQGRNEPSTMLWPAALFWVALGCCVLVKGPAGILVLGATAAALAATQREWRWLLQLRPLWGLPLTLAIVLPWMAAIAVRTEGAFFAQAIGHNMLGKMSQAQESHGSPPGYYIVLFVVTFWPGSLLAVQALPGIWANRRLMSVRFLLCWILPAWVVFECIPTKLPHYVLPTYPAIALLSAAGLTGLTQRHWQKWAFGAVALAWVAASVVIALGPMVLLWHMAGEFDPLALGAGLACLVFIATMLHRASSGRRHQAACAAVVAAVIANAAAFGRVLPEMSTIWLSSRIAQLVHSTQPCATAHLVSGNYNEPSLVFLLGTTTQLTDPVTAARALLNDPDCGLVLIGNEGLSAFGKAVAASGAVPRELGSVTGIDYSNGRRLDLHLFTLAKP